MGRKSHKRIGRVALLIGLIALFLFFVPVVPGLPCNADRFRSCPYSVNSYRFDQSISFYFGGGGTIAQSSHYSGTSSNIYCFVGNDRILWCPVHVERG